MTLCAEDAATQILRHVTTKRNVFGKQYRNSPFFFHQTLIFWLLEVVLSSFPLNKLGIGFYHSMYIIFNQATMWNTGCPLDSQNKAFPETRRIIENLSRPSAQNEPNLFRKLTELNTRS